MQVRLGILMKVKKAKGIQRENQKNKHSDKVALSLDKGPTETVEESCPKFEVCHASLCHNVGVPRRLGSLEHVSSNINGVVHSCKALFRIYFYVKVQW